jgi:glycosyltransferase involved in cell wall biosynthesis
MTVNGHSRLLKILHIDPERNWGGGEAQVLGLLTYLFERGHHNDLLTYPGSRLFQQSQALGVRTFPLIVRNDLDLRPLPRIRQLIRAEHYDIIHFHTKRAHTFSLWLSHGSATPKYVVTRRMDYPETNNWYTRCLYNRKVDGVVAISRKILELLVQAGVEPEKIRLIHSGIEPRRFGSAVSDCGVQSEEIVVGMAAVLEERKGHRFLLEAARRLKAQGCRIKYHLAGEGSLRKSLQDMAGRMGLKEDVQFLGFVTDMPAFLSKIDIFVLPSVFEGLGVSVLEAMAAGKAVIASRVGGLTELVMDGVTGLLVGTGDAEGLASAILKLADDRALIGEMGRKGRERVNERFTMEQMAKQNEDYYYDLLGRNRNSQSVTGLASSLE